MCQIRLPVDHYRDGQGEDEDPGESTETANQLSKESLGVEVVAHCSDRHQAPPDDSESPPPLLLLLTRRTQ